MTDTANIAIEILRTTNNIMRINNEFSKNIFENRYFINLDYLLDESNQVEFKQIWEYNPQKFCSEYYELADLYPIVLLTNKLNSIFEFKAERLKNFILAPTATSIYKVLMLLA